MPAGGRVSAGRASVPPDGFWGEPPLALAHGTADVHVWKVDQRVHRENERALREMLDAGERARADRFHSADDRTRYVVAHGLLRTLLGGYAGVSPVALQFDTGEHGKPRLASPAGASIEFNMSHAGDVVLIAFATGHPVGVDVEAWITEMEHRSVAEQFFSPAERTALAPLHGEALHRAFFACWTRKEAYIKATGLGVSAGLDYFDVALAENGQAALLADRRHPGATQQWAMRDLPIADGYSGALVCAATTVGVECFDLDRVTSLPR